MNRQIFCQDFCRSPLAKRLFGRFLARFLDAGHGSSDRALRDEEVTTWRRCWKWEAVEGMLKLFHYGYHGLYVTTLLQFDGRNCTKCWCRRYHGDTKSWGCQFKLNSASIGPMKYFIIFHHNTSSIPQRAIWGWLRCDGWGTFYKSLRVFTRLTTRGLAQSTWRTVNAVVFDQILPDQISISMGTGATHEFTLLVPMLPGVAAGCT